MGLARHPLLSVFHDEKVISRFGDNQLFISCEAAASIERILRFPYTLRR